MEFYLHTKEHPDPYVHMDQQQKTVHEWYFHKAKANGENYKGGTFKGLDITFGEEIYGGILIRTIGIKYEGRTEIIEGPCNVVNMNSLDIFNNSHLKLISYSEENLKNVYACRRVGLKMDKNPKYGAAEYRFMIEPRKIKKDRNS